MADMDLNGILSMFQAQPSLEERRQAANQALTRMGLGILAGNQPSRLPMNPLGVLAQGGMGGLDAYQGSLDKQLAERRANAGLAMQGMQLKKEMERQEALKGLLSESQPSGPMGGPPPAMGAQPGMQPVMPRQSYNPVPLGKLAAAAAGGVNIDPFLKLNEQVQPKPTAAPYHLSDLPPEKAREFLLSERQAGASRNIQNVNAFAPASEEAQRDFIKSTRATYDQLKQAPVALESIEKAKTLIPSAKGFMGPGGETLLDAAKFLNNRIPGMSINTEGVKSAEELRTRIFFNIMDNLKKMDAQPSQMQQQIMMESLGKLGTDPNALPAVLDAFADVIKGKVQLHNTEVEGAIKRGVKFPYDPVIKMQAQQPSGMTGMPPAARHKGRVIEDSTGKRYKSDGMTWRPL